jgi:hypothetical protein
VPHLCSLWQYKTLQVYEVIFFTNVGIMYACSMQLIVCDILGPHAPLSPFQCPYVVGVGLGLNFSFNCCLVINAHEVRVLVSSEV